MRIAIVGTGISGLLAANLLSREHEVSVFEANDYLGGHTNTIDVETEGGPVAVDTGFIVFNEWTYPRFIGMIEGLGVAWHDSDMSFSVRCDRSGLEYNGTSLDTLFAQRRNLFRPSFLGMIREILRFNREAPALLDAEGDDPSLGDYLAREGYSSSFVENYLVPMSAAVWSTPPGRMGEFPARTLIRFFENHGFLSVDERPTWRVITGGSKSYIGPLSEPFAERVRLSCPVEQIERRAHEVLVRTRGANEAEPFDHVVIATHSDQALRMLADPSVAERDILGAIPYQANRAVLHTDASVMPRTPRAWASWNYHRPREQGDALTVTYWMNLLQGLRTRDNYFVTLNPAAEIDPSRVLRSIHYEHPLFTREAVAAQARRGEISGVRRTSYCGAYWYYGFHEDGVRSALAVADELHVRGLAA